MDALKAQLARIQEQLSKLTASQKMLAMSLVAVMVLTLLFWGRYAGTAEMEPLLDQTMKADEVSRITGKLRAMGIEYKVVNDRVMVSADRKLEALGELSFAQLVPDDTRNAYEEIINKISPWDSQANSDGKRNDAKNAFLSQVIKRFPGVAIAAVYIDPTRVRAIGGGGQQPKATVQISTRDGMRVDNKVLARSAAATVAGAQSGLTPDHVTVVINGVTQRVQSDATSAYAGADDALDAKQQAERAETQKLREFLSFIDGVLVTVTVDVNMESKTSNAETFDPKGIAKAESLSETDTREENTTAPTPTEPGAVPNTSSNSPMSVGGAGAGGGGTTSNQEKNSTKFENRFSSTRTQTNTPAGKPKVLAAAVRVPRSYFVNIWKSINPSAGKDADEAALAPLLAAELPKIRAEVKNCTKIESDTDISVETYTDVLPAMLAAAQTNAVGSGAGGSAVTGLLGSHYKEIGVAVLALMSLWMVSGMVKKSAPTPLVAVPPMELSEAPSLASGEEVAGDVGEGGAMLDGVEMDDDSVKAQQMVEQVSTMVKENPDAAANLVKRWLMKA